MKAVIYKPAASAMQSSANITVGSWIFEYEKEVDPFSYPVMGWTGSSDANSQVKLSFRSKADAVDYAKRNNIKYEVIEPHKRKVIPKSYADNFK